MRLGYTPGPWFSELDRGRRRSVGRADHDERRALKWSRYAAASFGSAPPEEARGPDPELFHIDPHDSPFLEVD
jgi:hypothetical protein